MSNLEHNVAVRVGGKTIERWSDYSIELDMLKPADSFDLTLGKPSGEVFELVAPDAAVEVLIDGVTILSGFIDDRKWTDTRGGTGLRISGRDKGGRLVDESMPLMSFRGIGIRQLAEAVARPWFDSVILSNATNRRLLRGEAAKNAHVTSEPAIATKAKAQKKVNPGESRWQVLQSFLEEAELLAWSTADGKALVVGLPNYAQEPQFYFFQPRELSERAAEGNILECEIADSVGERYSAIVACGAGQGDSSDYSDRVTKRRGIVRNGPGPYGTGKDFSHRKVLIVSDDDVRSMELADARARREMAERDASGHKLHLRVKGHAQLRGEDAPALYGPDNMVLVEHEETGVVGAYLVTAAKFEHSRREGETTSLELVPEGTVLKL